MGQWGMNILEKKDQDSVTLEPKLLKPSNLALETVNCPYEEFFHNRQPVTISPKNKKKLIKRKILELLSPNKNYHFSWDATGQKLLDPERADFWWEKKSKYANIDHFIHYFNIISPSVIKYFNNQIDDQLKEMSRQAKLRERETSLAKNPSEGQTVSAPQILSDTNFFLVPFFASKCYRKEPIQVSQTLTPFASLPENWGEECYQQKHRANNPAPIIIPPSAYMCVNPFYTEYVISLFFSDFYTHKKSIHFVLVEDNSFSTCLTVLEPEETKINEPNISINELFIMERIEGYPLWDKQDPGKRPLPSEKEYQNACLIQVLHSIAVYQKELISHNDLHGGNILIEQMLFSTRWNNQELINYDYFQYKLEDNENLYIPFVPFIAKIIDFGLSCKYSEPQILNNKIMKGMIDSEVHLRSDENKIHKVVIPPNWYFPAYDVLMFLINFCVFLFPENLLAQQILWVALRFSELEEYNDWPHEEHLPERLTLPTETNAKEFYLKHNAFAVQCITGYNFDHSDSKIQIVLEDNVIANYKNLDASSLLKKCINNKAILKPYTKKSTPKRKCIILGEVD